MGASDKLFPRRLSGRVIPKEQLGEATSWEFDSLAAADPKMRSAERLLTDREQRAYERGRAEGVADATRLAQEEAARTRATHTAQIDKVLGDLRARFAELESAGADQVLELALEVARQVVRHDLESGREALLPVVREAVNAVIDEQSRPRVHMNPADYELIAADLDSDGSFRHCQFQPDPTVGRGGCRVETAHSEIDARLETRWSRALAALGITDPWHAPDGAETR